LIPLFLRQNFTRLSDLSPRFGALYHSLTPSNLYALNYHTWFLLRRLLFVATAVYLTWVPYLQVTLLLLQSLLSLCYLTSCMPFESALLNRCEIFNEATLYMVCYPTIMFLMMDNEDASYSVGWGLIVMILANIGVNVVIMVVVSVRVVWLKCRGRECCCKKV
jgi:hypothetical protein